MKQTVSGTRSVSFEVLVQDREGEQFKEEVELDVPYEGELETHSATRDQPAEWELDVACTWTPEELRAKLVDAMDQDLRILGQDKVIEELNEALYERLKDDPEFGQDED